jgi:hypothetical protein
VAFVRAWKIFTKKKLTSELKFPKAPQVNNFSIGLIFIEIGQVCPVLIANAYVMIRSDYEILLTVQVQAIDATVQGFDTDCDAERRNFEHLYAPVGIPECYYILVL